MWSVRMYQSSENRNKMGQTFQEKNSLIVPNKGVIEAHNRRITVKGTDGIKFNRTGSKGRRGKNKKNFGQ